MSEEKLAPPPVPFKYPKECELRAISSLNLEDRARKDFGDLQELAESISEVGLIHPPTIDGNGILLAGERRIRAMQLLGCEYVPVIQREKMSSFLRKEAELHENTRRLRMKWQEKVMLIHDAHRFREHENALEGKPWYQRDTGALFGQSSSSVHNALQLAEYIKNNDQEILECPGITQAIQILTTRAEQLATEEQTRRHGKIIKPNPQTNEVKVIDLATNTESGSILPSHVAATLPSIKPSFQEVEFNLGEMCHLGDCIEIMAKLRPGSVAHVVTDIPYGIDIAQMEIKDKETIAKTHDVEQNVEMMPRFLEQAYRLIGTKGGFCVFFYDLDHHEKLQTWAKEVGFEVCRWPYIWIKTHQCQNKSAHCNPTKCTEYAMILRRNGDSPTTLIKPWPKNYIICDASVERKLYDNPFAKPAAVWTDILEHIAFTGQTILDPYAGQFSSARAMINLGLKPCLIEIERKYFERGVSSLIQQLNEITNNAAKFTNNPLSE